MNKVEITIQDIFWCLRKYLIWIILTTIVFAVGAWVYTKKYVTPMYNTQLSFSIRASARTNDSVTANELTADARLASLYCALMGSDLLTQSVSDELGGIIHPSLIKAMTTATAGKDSPIISIYINSPSPQNAYLVAEALAKVAPEVIPVQAGAGELICISAPHRPTAPYTPIIKDNVVIGLLIGLLLSCGIVILIAVLDTTVWREEDLERAFDIPVLGSVPSMNTPSHSTKIRRKN